MSHLVSIRETLDGAAEENAEILTDPIHADLLAMKVKDAAKRRAASEYAIAEFQDLTVNGLRAVREAVNAGGRDIDAVLRLLHRAQRFKKWLANTPPDANLVKEYARASLESTWADRLPTKSARWALFTGAGLGLEAVLPSGVGTLIGIGAGAFDTFFLDKIIKGWRPNQFVDADLLPFLLNK